MKHLLIITLLYTTIGFAQTNNLRCFYFPVEEFVNGKTYHFVDRNDTTNHQYWKMKTEINGSDTIFKTAIYNKHWRLAEEMSERVSKGNAKFLSYTLYQIDSIGNKRSSVCSIVDSVVFDMNLQFHDSIKWSLSFRDFETPNMCELSKVRYFLGEENGMALFYDAMAIKIPGLGVNYEYNLECIYKKGKGLIAYTVISPYSEIKHYILSTVY